MKAVVGVQARLEDWIGVYQADESWEAEVGLRWGSRWYKNRYKYVSTCRTPRCGGQSEDCWVQFYSIPGVEKVGRVARATNAGLHKEGSQKPSEVLKPRRERNEFIYLEYILERYNRGWFGEGQGRR